MAALFTFLGDIILPCKTESVDSFGLMNSETKNRPLGLWLVVKKEQTACMDLESRV